MQYTYFIKIANAHIKNTIQHIAPNKVLSKTFCFSFTFLIIETVLT